MRLSATRLGSIASSRGSGNPLYDLSGEIPTLDLQFATTKTLDSRVTFTRASSATYAGADGTVKTARTNLLLRSEEFNIGSWAKINTTITADAATSPTGTLTADKLVETATTNGKLTAQPATLVASATYSASIYIKAAERPTLLFHVRESSYNIRFGGFFNTSTGVFTAESAGGGVLTDSFFTNIGNGWYRCTITGTLGAVTSAVVTGYLANNVNNISYLGDGTSGIYLWGAQLEQASTVGDYIQTTSAINSAPRFDHNPTTGESLGLLVEEARTNLVTSSADFSTGWTPTRAALTTNQTTAPDGTTTADLLTEDTSTNTHVIQNTFAVTSGTSYTLSVWVKQNASVSPTRNIRLFLPGGQFGSGSAVAAGFDLATGVITVTNSPSATSLQFYANGWVRVSVTSTCTTTSAASSISLQMTSGVSTSYTGGSSGLYLWGAQLEAGAFMTSYIPTTGTTATRAADVASITGSNFSSWYNQTEGTVFADAKEYPFVSTLSRTFYGFDSSATPNADFNRQWIWNGNTTLLNNSVYTSSSGPTAAEFSSTITNEQKRTALAYKINDYARSYNGGAVVTDLSGNLPVGIDRLGIGSSNNSQYLNGTIKRLTYWPTRLSDTALQSITAP
jgi:hypothetical protein